MEANQQIDVLILTAIKPEYDAVLDVSDGAAPNSEWVKEPGPTGLEVAFRDFQGRGGPLRVAVTRIPDMGEVWAASAGAPLIYHYKPQVLAMCGVCAGRPDWVQLGDVIVADTLWKYDAGESVSRGAGRKKHTVFRASTETYKLHSVWKERAESLSVGGATWLSERPLAIEVQLEWLLAILLNDADPAKHPERAARCPNFEATVKRARKRRWVAPTTLKLTKTGTAEAKRLASLHPDGPPAPGEFRIHVAPMASGAQVIQDGEMWDRLAERVRKVCGLEMEAAAVGAMQWFHGVDKAIVMKAVMDFANEDKDDHFKPFAARASAECLIKFLRENLQVVHSPSFGGAKESGPPKKENIPPATRRLRSERLAATERKVVQILTKVPGAAEALATQLKLDGPSPLAVAVTQALLSRETAEEVAQVCNYADNALHKQLGSADDRRALHEVLFLVLPIVVNWEALAQAAKSENAPRNCLELPLRTKTITEIVMAGLDDRGCRFAPPSETEDPFGAAMVRVPTAARAPFFQSKERLDQMLVKQAADHLAIRVQDDAERLDRVRARLKHQQEMAPPEERFSYYVVFDADLAQDDIWQLARTDTAPILPNLHLVRVVPGSPKAEMPLIEHLRDIFNRK